METITVNFGKWRSGLVVFINLFYLIIISSWPFWLDASISIISLPIGIVLLINARRGWQELTGKRPALIIDKSGIVDNIHWYSLGRVTWDEIDSIKTKRLLLVKTIAIFLKNPHVVVQKEKRLIKRAFQRVKTILQGTPMVLQTKNLAISYNELATLLRDIDFDKPDFIDMSKHLID